MFRILLASEERRNRDRTCEKATFLVLSERRAERDRPTARGVVLMRSYRMGQIFIVIGQFYDRLYSIIGFHHRPPPLFRVGTGTGAAQCAM